MRKLMIGILVTLVMVFALAPAASALERRQADHVLVDKGETIYDDVILLGDTVTIEGTVDGDVFAFANSVYVRGTINGNLITAATRVDIDGTVMGTAFAGGTNVNVKGRIERNLVAAGSSLNLAATGSIGRSVLAAGDRIVQKSNIERSMLVAGNAITVDGKVGDQVEAYANDLRITASAVVGGPVTFTSRNQAHVDPGARTGALTHKDLPVRYDYNYDTHWAGRWWQGIRFVSFVLLGLAILALFPTLRRTFPQTVLDKFWQVPLTGIVTMVVFPILFVILLLTVVGIPISFLLLAALPVVVYAGQVLVSYSLAKLLSDRIGFMANWSWPLLFLAGAILTSLLTVVPAVGWVFTFAFLLYGLGGMVWLANPKNRAA